MKNPGCKYCKHYNHEFVRGYSASGLIEYKGACFHDDNIKISADAVTGAFSKPKRKEIHSRWNRKLECKRFKAHDDA